MARKKTPSIRLDVKSKISARLREVRQELYGEHGGPELARRLGLPARTWYNYETGVTVPAEVLLSFIDQTETNPLWLLTGEGHRFTPAVRKCSLADMTPEQLIRRGLEKLEQEPNHVVLVSPENLPEAYTPDFVAVDLVPFSALALDLPGSEAAEGHILAYRKWIPHPRETVAVQLVDEAMHPILPIGSVVAIDLKARDPLALQGKMVAAFLNGSPLIRWLDVSGRHLIFRPNQTGSDFPMIPIEHDGTHENPAVLGQVVWSWSRFSG